MLVAVVALVGVQVSAASATRRLPGPVLGLLGFIAHFAVFALPVALAISLAVRRQWRRLAEAVLAGVAVMLIVALANVVLLQHPFSLLYEGLAVVPAGGGGRAAAVRRVPGRAWSPT